jgi:predicted aconitase with swiveling domain/ADP-ribose pyrophosphatase YjhB (NUDIX family)
MILKGRGLSKGSGEADLLISTEPVSFLGEVDAKTGKIIDEKSEVFGESVAGKVFAFPSGKGSTVGSYVLYGLALNDCAPVAILNERSEVVVTVGVIISGIPLVDCLDLSLLRTGDKVKVDGSEGSVDVEGIVETHVVTSFLENDGKILLLKRSELVGTYQGIWAGVSGYLEKGDEAIERAVTEIEEEVGISNPVLLKEGKPVSSRDEKTLWVVHPFLFHVDSPEVKLDWEHKEHKWISPSQIPEFKTVPRLTRAFDAVVQGLRRQDGER